MLRRTFLISVAASVASATAAEAPLERTDYPAPVERTDLPIDWREQIAEVRESIRKIQAGEVPVRKKVVTATVIKRGMHSHLCRCGYELWHFSGSHLCPGCRKRSNYTIHRYA